MKYKCSIENCQNKRTAKKLCQLHYDRFRASSSKRRFAQLLKKCKENNRTTDLTEEQVLQISSKNCHYCGQENKSTGHGLDRIDSTKDYLLGNVVSCCGNCNRAKSDLHQHDFLKMVSNIYNFNKYKLDKLYDLSYDE